MLPAKVDAATDSPNAPERGCGVGAINGIDHWALGSEGLS